MQGQKESEESDPDLPLPFLRVGAILRLLAKARVKTQETGVIRAG